MSCQCLTGPHPRLAAVTFVPCRSGEHLSMSSYPVAKLHSSTAIAIFSGSEQDNSVATLILYGGAALAEIAGCFAFWAWLRLGKSAIWLIPGMLALAVFAYLLARVDADFAGRAYAAYGGVYVASSLLWLWAVEGMRADRWDLAGAAMCLIGAAVIVWGPRAP